MYDRNQYILTDSSIKKDLLSLFSKNEKLIIFDVGACEGEESIRYSRLFPNSNIFTFEPLPDNVKIIASNIDKYTASNIEFIQCALSDEIGIKQFHISSGHPHDQPTDLDWNFGNKSSSLLKPDKHTDLVPWIKFDQTVDVQTTTLHQFLMERQITYIDFLHMDVQGAELKVLIGAQNMIEHIKAIWMEVADITLYKNQPKREEIEKYMAENGFTLFKSIVHGGIGDQFYINTRYFKSKSFLSYRWFSKV